MAANMPRCGRISYTNDLPVYTAFDEGVVMFPGTLTADVPSNLNRALLEGELDISPISSALYAEHASELRLLPSVCIGAPKAARSIYCIASREPASLSGEKVEVSKESLTARTLFRVICRTWYGFDPMMAESDDPLAGYLNLGTPCLLIGDKAIDATEMVPRASLYDLGELWHALTGTGMVFAVWAVREQYARTAPEATRAVAAALAASLDWGLDNLELVARRAQTAKPRSHGFYAEYYHALNFRFDEPARAALSNFFTVARDAGITSQAPALQFVDQVPQHV